MAETTPGAARNPETQLQHNKQKMWQIIIPITAATVGLISLAVLVVISAREGGETTAVWAHISLIWILVPIMVTFIAVLAILIFINYGLSKAIGVLPGLALKAQTFIYEIAIAIRKGADKTVLPFFSAHQTGAAIGSIFRRK